MKEYKLYIDNQWLDAGDGGTFASYHKATGEEVNRFAAATEADVDRACRAARAGDGGAGGDGNRKAGLRHL